MLVVGVVGVGGENDSLLSKRWKKSVVGVAVASRGKLVGNTLKTTPRSARGA
jgi:hypothetical protein